jgi:cyclic pyranopterin phosphate synthase
MEGLQAARAAGFGPLKLNCVLQRGVNEDEILDLTTFAREEGHILRFIEFMDVGTTNGWQLTSVVPAAEARGLVHQQWPLDPVAVSGRAVAQTWRFRDGKGEVGFIASVTAPFCRGCDRARLSADGHLYTCLFAKEGLDLKGFLRSGYRDEDLASLLSTHWKRREDRYSEQRHNQTPGLPKIEMSHIGG